MELFLFDFLISYASLLLIRYPSKASVHTFRIILLLLSLFPLLILIISTFVPTVDANTVIKRQRRASSLHLEEILQGNLERECLEERCTHEEAREVFENDEMLQMFWDAYYGGRRCSSSPCQHNGVCEDSIRGYTCTCAEGYEGENCAFGKASPPC
uniref:Uncharacterized protein n=1 Tax=Melopsittacus undulatus TaxID=13146 RepID=A0A8V5FKB6_MELUD